MPPWRPCDLSQEWLRFGNPESGRGGQIRTDDIRVPNAALYQAELRPVHGRTLVDSRRRIKKFFNQISNLRFSTQKSPKTRDHSTITPTATIAICHHFSLGTTRISHHNLPNTTGELHDREAEIFRRTEKTLRT